MNQRQTSLKYTLNVPKNINNNNLKHKSVHNLQHTTKKSIHNLKRAINYTFKVYIPCPYKHKHCYFKTC